MKIAIAQMNACVGDIIGNEQKISENVEKAIAEKADLIVFPELCTTGYPPKDLLEYKKFIKANLVSVERLKEKSHQIGILLGYADFNQRLPGKPLQNCACLLFEGEIRFRQAKTLLPTYDVFDEDRYFQPAEEHNICEFKGERLGIFICEDIWDGYETLYPKSPSAKILAQNPTLLINLSSSPFQSGKFSIRKGLVSALSKKGNCPFIYVNAAGANDELIFDGNSFATNEKGEICHLSKGFEENLEFVETSTLAPIDIPPVEPLREIYQALVLGIREYALKCKFKSVVIGLSGGIDSALVALLACDSLGPENVLGVSMPSEFSSEGSVSDVKLLVQNLGIRWKTIPIQAIFGQFRESLSPVFEGRPFDVAEENLQARIRGMLLMALSNKFGYLVLSTGNKSEMAVGYCTLYGDMCGGLSVISDLPKTIVYKLSRFLNQKEERIPWNIIDKPPSAELRPDQKDLDSLPEYSILDGILEKYVEGAMGEEDIVAQGYDAALVKRIIKMVDQNEYKRFQSPPGLKITSKAFGIGRRFPLAKQNRWFQ